MLAAPEQINNNISDKPIGTGPFKVKEWIRDARFVATRNADYWRKDPSGAQYPYLAEVEFRPLPDVNTRINALESGDVNIIHDNHPNQLDRMKRAAERGDFQYIQGGGEDEETFLLLNMAKPPLDDVRVRQAIAHATDKDQYLAITGGDPSSAADSFLSKESPFYADVGFPTYDPAKARELVNAWKADHPGQELELTITTTPTPENQQIIQAFAKQWEDVGIKAAPQAVDQAQFILTGVTGKYDVNLWRQYSAPDPDGEYHWWTSENAGPIDSIALNFARLNDPQVDQALNTGRSNPDPAARKQAYVDLQRRFAELVPYVWLDHVQWALVAGNTVRGILNAPLPDGQPSIPVQAGVHRLTQTWLDT
jgi:ABC-type transport system substrate-binding protein